MTEPVFLAYPFDAAFSEAVQIGHTIYLSGHIGDDDDGNLAEGFDAEVRQMMANVSASLARFERDLTALVSVRVMLTDMANLDRFNTLFATYFHGAPLPVCSVFAVTQLALDAAIEIECVASTAPTA
ncbi:RidA family protein [Asticcacaulis sp. BYS171W]|uniref:RidA family protein n=1 Tax=Asticcacaulis aquaticus TaxID=2984212 RepID=A0ABT5HU90_9CAUL|nr:RidA family protein [Asticcacaulis aquaticus]MDC7683031.1 RidA family protein [Asticcacaulis aquaticus]